MRRVLSTLGPVLLLFNSFGVLSSFSTNFHHGVNGGITCSACTMILGVVGQVAEIQNSTVVHAAYRICSYIPHPLRSHCKSAVDELGSVVRDIVLSDTFTPDVICYGLGYCHVDPEKHFCHLFPAPPEGFEDAVSHFQSFADTGTVALNPCHLRGLRTLCHFFLEIFSRMKPAWDLDGDMFSDVKFARGSHWRGRDCRDWDSTIYPGRKPERADVDVDADCNGIWGLDEGTGIPWETQLCEPQKRGTRGLIVIGDSVGAHFHFPEKWMNPLLISEVPTTFQNVSGPLLDELDWPQLSFATGYENSENSSAPRIMKGFTHSVYRRLRQRNLCNHRDYQNICRNGADSFSIISYVDNVARTHADKPALVLIGVLGNDVCNRFPDTISHRTPPSLFYSNVKSAVDKLSARLPAGSHVVLMGLADGSFIYPVMSERMHPIGKLHGNVKYKDVYKWLECMETSPCVGWLSENIDLRKDTTKAAETLSQVLENIVSTATYVNITVHYIPDPLSLALKYWEDGGGKLWEIIESVDGLHPNQRAQSYIAKAIWRLLYREAPEAVGVSNSFNGRIQQLFGDQGGH